MTTSKK